MVPPKKDAFADLFQSANKGNGAKTTKLGMAQQQQMAPTANDPFAVFSANGSGSSLGLTVLTPRSNTPRTNGDSGSVIDQFDIFTENSYPKTQPTPSTNNADDPFAIFGTNGAMNGSLVVPGTQNRAQNGTQNGTTVLLNKHSSTELHTGMSTLSLLDDDFTDAFQSAPVEQPKPRTELRPKVEKPSSSTPSLTTKDHVIAELVDIGFDINDANDAVARNGPDLQKCVNDIMNRSQSAGACRTSNHVPGARNNGSSRYNDNSTNNANFNTQAWLSKGVSLLNLTKNTVMKNIDQFVEGQISHTQSTKDNVPAWMKSTEKYKHQATEKKYGGEDYGSDAENINHDEIARFMQLQQQKEKERAAQRYHNLKGNLTPKTSKPSTPNPQSPIRTPRIPERRESPVAPQRATVKAPRDVQKNQPSPPPSVPKHQEENVDLLGMSTPVSTSKLRVNTPLNQFEQTDFDSAKTNATEAYKSGDYTTALESYLICTNTLPANHELQVVITSNLAVVYKLVGQLKNSLEYVNKGVGLIEEEEISNGEILISSKPVKYWYTKLIICKAEVLELLENYEESLENYSILIQKLGVVDRKITDGRRRVHKVVNPEAYKPKPSPKPTVSKPSTPVQNKRQSVPVPKKPEPEEFDALAKEKIDIKIDQWVAQKQDNLRSLLAGLNDIIPAKINMQQKLRTLTINELMLPKQVKINYMKVISAIHPDKLASQCKDDKEAELICNAVFIKLNKSWEQFKLQESV
jgi:hypothetical protein